MTPPVISRRALLTGGAASLVAAGCSRRDRAAPPSTTPAPTPQPPAAPTATAAVDAGPSPGATRLLEWSFDATPSERAVIVVPERRRPDERFPLLIALHGRGEALKDPSDGAMGWPRDYALVRAFDRLAAPPLVEGDFEGLVTPDHLGEINRGLAARAFGRLVVACPYVPDVNLGSATDIKAYGRFLLEVLLPRVRAEAPVLAAPEATGIDGVSLGGALALRVGLGSPETFGSVGALQPAIGDWQTSEWTELAKAARAKRAALKLRLTTSEDDAYRAAVTHTSEAWTAAGVAHDFAVLPGPHDYVFNRGPGVIEMLFSQDRALAH